MTDTQATNLELIAEKLAKKTASTAGQPGEDPAFAIWNELAEAPGRLHHKLCTE